MAGIIAKDNNKDFIENACQADLLKEITMVILFINKIT
jgi:hypothetical protein